MTETDWLTCTSRPADMLRHVRLTAPARKLQLVGCSSCRLIWEYLPDGGATAVIEMERYGDRWPDEPYLNTQSDLRDEYLTEREGGDPSTATFAGLSAAYAVTTQEPRNGLGRGLEWVQETASRAVPDGEKQAALNRTRQQICDLFREVIGNPFRPWKVVPDFYGGGVVQPDGKTVRLTGTARQLAEGIRADQAFDRLPILADALEEAGITDVEMLAHCRREGGHVRGCWALDVVLGKV